MEASPAAAPTVGEVKAAYDTLLVTRAIFVSIATATVLSRLYVRTVILKNIGLDELCIVIALILAIASFVLTGMMVNVMEHYIHAHPLLTFNIIPGLMYSEISVVLTILSVTFTRTSICFFLLRIVGSGQQWKSNIWKRGLYAIMAFSIVTGVPTAILVLVQCNPVEKGWHPFMPGRCWSPQAILYIADCYGAVSVIADWTLASLPIIFMWKIQMKRALKIGVCVLMGLGYFTGICALIKTVLLNDANGTGVNQNLTRVSVYLGIWAFLEIDIGIIAASIPTLRPLFSRDMRKEHYNKRRYQDTPDKGNEKRRGNRGGTNELETIDVSKFSQPSSSATDFSSRGESSATESTYKDDGDEHATLVPSVFEKV